VFALVKHVTFFAPSSRGFTAGNYVLVRVSAEEVKRCYAEER
jgi:ferredoxin-NADP reductase